jgi:hypothetical protein
MGGTLATTAFDPLPHIFYVYSVGVSLVMGDSVGGLVDEPMVRGGLILR